MVAQEVGQEGHAPEFINCGNRVGAVADAGHDGFGEVPEPACDVAVAPAAKVGEGRRQFPMVERGAGFEVPFQHRVDQPVVEIEPFGVHRSPVGHHPRPACREAVGVKAAVAQQVEVGLVPVVMIASPCTIFGADDIAGRGGEVVPHSAAGAAILVSFDLVGRGCSPEEELFGKVGAFVREHDQSLDVPGAGPVEAPETNSASQSLVICGACGARIRSMSICASAAPAARTEDCHAVNTGWSPPLPK